MTTPPDAAEAHESLLAAIHEEVRLVPHDPAWPLAFAAERGRLLSVLPGRFAAIEHIGSTAVPGLAAKPIVDLLAGVGSMAAAEAVTGPLLAAGYGTSAAFNATLADRRWFMRWADGRRTHHLHVVVHGGEAWRERIDFRDALRSDPSLAARYARLKHELAAAFATDREAYTVAKGEFVRSALQAR